MRSLIFFLMLAVTGANAVPAVGQVNVEGQINPRKPFTVLVIANEPQLSQIRQRLSTPKSPQWQAWLNVAELDFQAIGAKAVERHGDLIAEIQRDGHSLPAVSLVDGMGGRWLTLSANELPKTDYELARLFDTYHAAVMQAAREATAGGFQTMTANQLRLARGGRSGFDRIEPGPNPWRQPANNGGLFNVNPQINVPEGFDNFAVDAQGSVDPETRSWGLIIALILGGSGIAIAAAIVVAAWMNGEARTRKPRTVPNSNS
jgi:hypothetical protein